MEITCAPSAVRRSALTIFCDGSPWRDVHAVIFGRKPPFPSYCPSEEALFELFYKLEHQMAKRYALKRLSVQNMLSDTLARSLKERLVTQKTIESVVGELCSQGWINDREWTQSFVRVQASRKVGPRAIAQKLSAKGVRGDRLDLAMEEALGEEEQKEQILALLKGKYKTRDFRDFREKQKVVAALVRRGFGLQLIISVIKKLYSFDDFELIDN